ncbi:MAG: tetratricopeptide repeat protein [Deltaproteobacteria bacterium]|nr:tetratricopeptide repeat protein [Deltaproteobacteria bacterium]
MNSWRTLLIALTVIVASATTLWAADEGEATIGRKFSLVIQAQLPLVRDPTVRRYVQRLGQKLVAHLETAEFTYYFGVIQEPHLNAFAAPGGYIYIHTGLIQRVQSDDELASVLGHEIAHVQGHHMVRQQQDTKFLSYAGLASMALALINPVLAAGVSSLSTMKQLQYKRQLEEEADYRGLQYLAQAGFNPHAMPQFFATMQKEDRVNGVNVPGYLRSHPLSKERLSYIERTIQALKWNQRAPSDTFELRRVQAILNAMQGARSRVIPDYERQVTENPDNPKALALLGTVLLQYNDWQRAQQLLEQAAAKGIRLDRELGISYLRTGNTERARQLFLQQREIDPQDADVHTKLCALLLKEGNQEEATKSCRAALDLDPYNDESYMTLAQIAQLQGKSGESRLQLGRAMEIQGRMDAALNQYQQAAQLLGPEDERAEELESKTNELEQLISQIGKGARRR